MKKTWSY